MGLLQTCIASLVAASWWEIFLLFLLAPTSLALYRVFLSPLSHIPGPRFAWVSSLFLYTVCYLGVEGRVLMYYHRKYRTQVLRIGPNAVSLSDPEALHTVYVADGGLPKDPRYSNFRVEGCDTIFSTLDPLYRDVRAKAVLPLFVPSRLRASAENDGIIAELVKKFIDILKTEKDIAHQQRAHGEGTRKVDVLDLTSKLSIDVLTKFLFKKVYGGLDEHLSAPEPTSGAMAIGKGHKLSATPFVLAIVAFGRFSLFPNWLFRMVFSLLVGPTLSKPEVAASLNRISEYTAGIMDQYTVADASSERFDRDTYQFRLLSAGISYSETLIQCKAAMFAGADSTAVMLSTILFHLIQRPDVLQRLKSEINQHPLNVGDQTLPYLRAVIREGLRLGMANPARLTRIVSPEGAGLTVSGVYLPPGTIVGAAAYVFHHNPDIFPGPFEFRPERWMPGHVEGQQDEQARRIMDKATFPFGLGSRACIGRNLAMQQLFATVSAVAKSGVLEGATTCTEKIELVEWFNAEIKGHHLDIQWL
ncbi:uncharacterized protein N7479_000793 [Penicillium vulpinum]|uniref:Uncharacterized protein n=1 Tax=Penicillium vulpinum TaxID=29845 RepID=A0A1V6S6A6_9EURO|nr:uncharacterized protein N7479_000793 [Penicillium vulpinum]KAJ5970875.1 hypothetical protein N7479_000793 [Penicillium vulpinum]OQE09582.1 hypothetical protein PENVUL_c006G04273 [Penicillium vulpinum]